MEDLILNGENIAKDAESPEQVVQFRKYSDFNTISVEDKDTGKPVASISGYGIQFGFDMKYVKTAEDIKKLAEGITDIAIQVITDAALSASKQAETDTDN